MRASNFQVNRLNPKGVQTFSMIFNFKLFSGSTVFRFCFSHFWPQYPIPDLEPIRADVYYPRFFSPTVQPRDLIRRVGCCATHLASHSIYPQPWVSVGFGRQILHHWPLPLIVFGNTAAEVQKSDFRGRMQTSYSITAWSTLSLNWALCDFRAPL